MKKWLRVLSAVLLLLPLVLTYAWAEENEVLNLVTDGRSDLVVVYDSTDRMMKIRVQKFVEQIGERYEVNIKNKNVARVTEPYAHELVIGNVRACAESVTKLLSDSSDFAICVQDGHLVCYADSDEAWQYLFEYLLNDLYGALKSGDLSIPMDYRFVHSQSDVAQVSYKDYYQSVYHTYSSYVDQFADRGLSKPDQEDQQLVEELVVLMGQGFAVYPGSSSALYQGYVVKLDTQDYSKVTRLREGHVLIASEFAQAYFGQEIKVQADGYVDLSAWCGTNDGWTLHADEGTNLYVVMPSGDTAFSEEHYQRMLAFFNNKYIPEPQVAVEQTRTVIVESVEQDVANCLDWRKASYDSYYDPALLAVEENGKTVLYAAYSKMPYVDGGRINTGTDLLVSHDLGASWTLVKTFSKLTAASTIVEIDGMIYVLGGFSQVQIVKYDPITGSSASTAFAFDVGYAGPGTPLIHNGRLYKPYGERIISAPIDSDLMDGANWTLSEPVSGLITEQWLRKSGLNGHGYTINGTYVDWEEGNIVLGKDGVLYVFYRQNVTRGCALILALSDDGKTLSYVDRVNDVPLERASIIDIPAAKTRHTIRFDEKTGLYLCVMNIYTGDAKTQYAWTDKQQRSVLALTASKDLVNWEIADVMVVDRKMMNPVLSVFAHGFQYADFTIAGDALYFIVRENSGEKTFNYHHEANYITLYTVENYARLLAELQVEE